MKKRKAHASKAAGESKQRNGQQQQQKQDSDEKKKAAHQEAARSGDSEDENEGFGNWLRSTDGVAYMRLFVLANSLLVLTTMSWSHVWQVVDIIRDAVGL